MRLPRGLDHVVHVVRDLDAARSRYDTLGFTTTPKALHPWGTGNSLVQLERSFIEILGIEQPERITPPGPGEFSFGAYNRDFLERREGMSMLVFSSLDAAADLARWRAAGLDTYAPFDFSRTATLPDGEQATVAFSLAFVTDPGMPDAAWFVCQQHHPEHFWKPQYQRHANSASGLDTVWLQADDPQALAGFLSRLFPEAEVVGDAQGITLELAHGRVAVRPPGVIAARFPGMRTPAPDRGPAFVAITLKRKPGASGRAWRECVAGLIVELD